MPLLAQRVSEYYLGRYAGHLHSGRLRQERHRSRRTRIDLDYKHLVILIGDELYVVQSDDAYALAQTHRIVDYRPLHVLVDAERGVDAYAVARVYARALDMLHDTRYEYILAVAYRIDLQLLAHYILVYQYGLVFVDLDRIFFR